MSTNVKDKKETVAEHVDGWDAMIRDAKKRILDLEYSIRVFERHKAAGEPCPANP